MDATILYISPQIFGLSIEVYFIALILAIPTFFFFKWLFKKFIKQSNTRKIVTWLTTIILVPIVYVGFISLFFIVLFHVPNRDFDRSKWFADKQNRFQMANNIIDSKMLIRKDTNQMKQLLGNPAFRIDSLKEWKYDMGMGGGGLGFLFHTLVIKFEKNRVTSVQHQEVED